MNAIKEDQPKAPPIVSISPDALMYLMDENMVVLITSAGEGKINVTVCKESAIAKDRFLFTDQDGIRIYYAKDLDLPNDRQVYLDVKKRMFFTSIRATVQQIPKGAGFMGTRGCH